MDLTKNAVDKTVQKFGKLNILVNNAGITGPQASIKDMEEEDYLKVINIDLNGTFFGMQAAIPELIKAGGGSIVNISSLAGLEYSAPTPNVVYPAAKFGNRGLTKAAAAQLAYDNIRVNAELPGAVLTPLAKENNTEEALENLQQMIPMNRLGRSEEISKMVLFLASDDSSFTTGCLWQYRSTEDCNKKVHSLETKKGLVSLPIIL